MAVSPTGHDGSLCGARKRQGEGTCTQVAGWGTSHVGEGKCKLHGGSTRNVSKGAHEAIIEREVSDLVGEPVENPLAAMAEISGRAKAWMLRLEKKVDALGDKIRYEDAKGAEQLRSEIALYERAMDRCANILATHARLNIDDRLARITDKQANAIMAAVEAVIAYLGATPEQADGARQVAGRHLASVA